MSRANPRVSTLLSELAEAAEGGGARMVLDVGLSVDDLPRAIPSLQTSISRLQASSDSSIINQVRRTNYSHMSKTMQYKKSITDNKNYDKIYVIFI